MVDISAHSVFGYDDVPRVSHDKNCSVESGWQDRSVGGETLVVSPKRSLTTDTVQCRKISKAGLD